MKNLLDRHVKQPGNAEGQGKGWVVFAGLDGVDSLTGHIEVHRKVCLRPITFCT